MHFLLHFPGHAGRAGWYDTFFLFNEPCLPFVLSVIFSCVPGASFAQAFAVPRVRVSLHQIFDFGLSKAVVKDHKLVGEAGSLR